MDSRHQKRQLFRSFCRRRNLEYYNLKVAQTVSSTFQDVDFDGLYEHSWSVDATITVSSNILESAGITSYVKKNQRALKT